MRLSDKFDGFNHTWVNTNSCYGHDHHDILPFSDLFNEGTGHFYSNQELYQAFDPRSPVLPYVYDTFNSEHFWCLISIYFEVHFDFPGTIIGLCGTTVPVTMPQIQPRVSHADCGTLVVGPPHPVPACAPRPHAHALHSPHSQASFTLVV